MSIEAIFPESDDEADDETVLNKLEPGDIVEAETPKPYADFKPSLNQPFPLFRCTHIKRDGERCKNMGLEGSLPHNAKCSATGHGGSLPSVKEKSAARVEAAKMRILEDTGLAVDTIEQLMQVGTADNIRLKAATEILDRAGIRGGIEVDVSGVVEIDTAAEVKKRLSKLLQVTEPDDDDEDIVDADVVEEDK